MGPHVYMEDIAIIICQIINFLHNIMITIADIYVSISGYIIQEIIIHQCRTNRQHSMLSHPGLLDISIYTCLQEGLLTFMLEDGVYITRTLN